MAAGDRQFAIVPRSSRREVINRYIKPAGRLPVILNGYAGTGKTQSLLDIAVSHASEGRQVLFTCYNKVLATSLRASMAVRDVPVAVRDRLLVKDVYDIKYGIEREGLDALAGSFGTVCVDEAQDMADGDLNFVARLATRRAEWFYADGPGQELYEWPGQPSVSPQRLAAARKPGHGVSQRLNRQFRTSSAAALFAFAVVNCDLDITKIPKWVAQRPIKHEESALDVGIGAGRGLPEIEVATRPAGTVGGRHVLLDSYVRTIRHELRTLRALASAGDLMIMLPKRTGETVELVRAALDLVGEPYLDQIHDDNRRRALPDGHIRLVTVHSARGVSATRALLFGTHEHQFGGKANVPPSVVNRNTGYIALTRARHGTRIVFVEGSDESPFGRFVLELHRAYTAGL